MYIGVISDTHGVFDNEFVKFLESCDVIWHAGDWGGDDEFIDGICALKPVVGVYGNCDGQNVRLRYPGHQLFDCEGKRVLMTHIGGYPGHYDLRAQALIENYKPDIFVCGHSHILKVMQDKKYNLLSINPGAAGIQGWHVVRTALRFKIEQTAIKDMEVFNLQRTKNF